MSSIEELISNPYLTRHQITEEPLLQLNITVFQHHTRGFLASYHLASKKGKKLLNYSKIHRLM